MTSMVDRVEEEIFRAMNGDPKGGSFNRAARAAIEAMLEPTPAMVRAWRLHGGYTPMIRAALNEEGQG